MFPFAGCGQSASSFHVDQYFGRRATMSAAGTLTRADLAESLHREVGLSRADAARLVEQILTHMCEGLSKGENVKISGFGSFILRDKGERVGRNPKTGVE